jgi:hypothetical protein
MDYYSFHGELFAGGISQNAVSHMKINTKQKLSTLMKISNIFGCIIKL